MTEAADNAPVYMRLRAKLAARILDGRYEPDAQLPSVRAFAAENAVNPLTVAKAYQCLQGDGYIEARRGVGMFVTSGATDRLRAMERDHFLGQIWPEMQAHIARLGLSTEELFGLEPI